MEAIISAAVGELVTRSISSLINRYLKTAPSKEESIQRLQWMLMRIHVTVEEAEGRRITNQVMLQQLNMLRGVMYKGYYMLDTVVQQHQEEEDYDHGTTHSLSLSKFNPAKRVCFSSQSKHDVEKIENMLECVATAISSMSEFVIFLRNYPPIFRQPYSTYLFIGNCMFGRQVEMERVINFLLYEEHPANGNIGVLPIVGPGKVGKTTLVEHVCRDERVRDHFSHIIFLSNSEFSEENELKIRDASRTKHQHCDSKEEKKLVIIEIVGSIDEAACRKLHSASQSSIPRGSKVIITSQSENIINIGTTQALNLKFLSREAYWYFFKALVFGSAYPEEHPRLASIAMAIFDEYFDQDRYKAFAGPFIYLNKTAMGLKSSVNVRNWNKILECFRNNRRQNEPGFRKRLSEHGMMNDDHILLQRVSDSTQYCVVHNHDRIALVNEEAPKITLHGILDGTGSVRPHSKFDILVWESHLPPYHKYIYSCQILEFDCNVSKNKQSQKRKFSS